MSGGRAAERMKGMKVKVVWLEDGKRNEKEFNSREEARPFADELNEKGLLWVITDKF
jgi:hypothetical protein